MGLPWVHGGSKTVRRLHGDWVREHWWRGNKRHSSPTHLIYIYHNTLFNLGLASSSCRSTIFIGLAPSVQSVEVDHPDVVTSGGTVPGQPVAGDVILRVLRHVSSS